MTHGFTRTLSLIIAILSTAAIAAGQISQGAVPGLGGGGSSRVEVDIATEGLGSGAQALVTLCSGFTNVPVASIVAQANAPATFRDLRAGSYTVEVTAPGFQPDREAVAVTGESGLYQVQVRLRPMSSAGLTGNLNPLLAPKARKELDDGLKALKSKDYDKARKHLDAAYKLAPGDPNVNFLMGMLALETKNRNEAQNYFLKATSLNPDHVPALVALGEVRLEQKDYAGASQPLQTAVSVAPKNWVAHWLLATTALGQHEFERARHEAQQAVKLGKRAAAGAQFVEGEALAALGQNQEALSTFQTFVRTAPENPEAGAAREMISRLDGSAPAARANSAAATTFDSPMPRATADQPKTAASGPRDEHPVSDMALPLSALPADPPIPGIASGERELALAAWQPPMLEDEKLVVTQGAACPAGEVLARAGQDAAAFAANLNSTEATERVRYDNVDRSGKPIEQADKKFLYLANVSANNRGTLVVEESRSGGTDPLDAPARVATFSASPLALAFDPSMSGNFNFTCRGLGQANGRAAWVVDFSQRPGRPLTLRTYETNGNFYPAEMKGRAWITADTFHIVRIEADLAKPIPEIGLLHEHDIVTYGPVHFASKNAEMWLPLSSDSYFNVKHRMYARQHTFSDYTQFSVSSSQKIGRPKMAEGQ
ncbi:MAG TPA: tetratricopeptide repeat protein [Candidatus Acidoferrales bacterium]|nr:tetratricopeptide repeat protein [Candidatus Acidoferrales bacterium]